jgi:hypothetical protein
MTDYAALEPHDSLEPLFDDIWTLQGSVVFKPLVRLRRTMTVVRNGDDLTLINSIRVNDGTLEALKGLGTIRNVVRIGFHGMDDAWYVEEHGATLWGLPGVEQGRGQTASELLAPDHLPFPNCSLFQFENTVKPEAALLVEREGGVLLTCDSVQNWESTAGCSLPAKVITHLVGFLKPAQIGPPWKKAMTPDGGSLKTDFERLGALPFKHLVGGHGVPLRDTANERFAETMVRVFG